MEAAKKEGQFVGVEQDKMLEHAQHPISQLKKS